MVSSTNPFIYGSVVSGKDFADRENEIKQILSDLEGTQNILLFSPRRFGKTSLILEVLARLNERDFLKVYLDLFPLTSKVEFAEAYATAIARATRKKEKGGLQEAIKIISEHIPGFRVVLKPDGSPVEFDVELTRTKRDVNDTLERLFDLPLKIARKEKKKIVVVFDEFQEVTNLDGKTIERLMRSKIQHHSSHVVYVFTGSKKHMLDEIFLDNSRALYRLAKSFSLGKIPSKEFAVFIKEKFRISRIAIEDSIIDKVLEISESHPYYTQQLCHELWNLSQDAGKVREEVVQTAVKQVISNQNYAYSTIWDSLRKTQRSVLLVLAALDNGREKIYSKDFLDNHDLPGASSVQRAIAALEEKGVIERQNGTFEISDVFLKKWLLDEARKNS
jgi:uncharacterized protein